MTQHRIAVVTGGSQGIGKATAELLRARGFKVFSGSRSGSAEPGNGIERLRLDVTDERSVSEAIEHVLAQARRIDVLVNCAGYALLGPVEDTSLDEAKAQFETNFFGVVRTTQAVLPHMRRQGQGRIINVSSAMGFLPAPYMGLYSASKHALEGFTETLDHEIRHLGIRALLVEPYFTKTALVNNGREASRSMPEYQQQRERTRSIVQQSIANGESAHAVADAVWRALSARHPKVRYPVGRSAVLQTLRRFAPSALFERRFRKEFGLAACR